MFGSSVFCRFQPSQLFHPQFVFRYFRLSQKDLLFSVLSTSTFILPFLLPPKPPKFQKENEGIQEFLEEPTELLLCRQGSLAPLFLTTAV